jgi:nucleoside-diphosphate-sugar epimerase
MARHGIVEANCAEQIESKRLIVQKVLITGGAGYIGAILTPALLATGHEVTVLDNFMYGQNSLLECCANERFQVIRGDCRDKAVLGNALKQKDVIIPLAALVGAPLCQRDEIGARTTNFDAIKLLLSLRSREQRILFPTTNSGYGIGQRGQFCTEETPLRPLTLYGTTKVNAEKAILDAGNAITLRLATVFGMSPRMRMDLLVNDFVYRAMTDRAVTVFEGHFKRNYIHVRDVACAFQWCLDHFDQMKDQPYNVGLNDANLSKLELCAQIKKHVPSFVHLEAPIGEDPDKRDYIVSNDKIYRTGFKPQYSLDMGIKELIKGCTILRNSRYSNV